MKALWLLLVTLALTGCVTAQEEYETYLNSFVGKTRKALIAKWGVPDRKFDVEEDGSEIILVYTEDHGISGFAMGNMIQAEHLVCKTQFTLLKGKVKSWSYDGDCG